MFRAITKKSANGHGADSKGTLTALWSKAGSKADNKEAPLSDAAPEGAAEPPSAQFTPAAASRASDEAAAAGQAAPPTTGGDVAIGAAPEPSPEPIAVAAQVAAEVQPPANPDAQPSKGTTAEKKRKRSSAAANSGFSEEQLERLQALFAQNEYAGTAAKTALATELGVELVQVSKWFEKQRKKVREETGAPPKRGRPKSGAASGSKPAPAAAAPDKVEPAAAAAGQEGGEAAAAAADAVEAGEGQEVEAMDVDGAAEDDQAAAQQQQTPSAPPAPVAAPAAALEPAEAMAADEAGVEPAAAAAGAAPATEITPAAATRPAAEAAPATQQAVSAERPAAAPAAASSPPTGAAAAPAKTPASVPQQYSLSTEDKAKLVADLEAEAEQLRRQGLAAPLQVLPADPPAERQPFSDARLAAAVAAQRAPLSQLAAAALLLFTAPDGEAPVEEAVLRSRIVDLAARKSFAPKERDGGTGMADALEDGSAAHLWQWELRDHKVLPKELRTAAQQTKKRAARVQERLSAVCAALRLLGPHQQGKASAKLAKALDALKKAKTLAQVEEEQQAEREAATAKEAAKKQQSAGKTGMSAEEKARLKAEKEAAKEAEKERVKMEKEAEKERLKAEKEAEKERAKAEKEAEREKAKAEREAEKERKHKEAEEAKLAKKTGFKDATVLKKTSNKFLSFFQAKATPGGTPGRADASAVTPVQPGASSQQQGGASQLGGGGSQQQQGAEGTATGKREKGYCELFLKPEGANLRSLPPQPSAAERMDAAAGQPFAFEAAQAEWQQLLQGMKRRRREAAAQPRPLGLPPTWARKSNAVELAQQHLDKLQESGADLAATRTWRRKLIFFPADSKRPAFYGSCTPSPAVGPRSYLGRDEALDYDAMSDLEWVEEPEDGCSLSDVEEEESEMGGGEEEEEHDSFICEDGYLSEDEGVRVEDLEGDDMQVDGEEGLPEGAAAAAGIDPQRLLSMQQLEVQMERARRAGKPLIISRLPTRAASGNQPNGAFIQGDPSLLGALAAEVLLPGLRLTLPEDLAAEPASGAAGAPATATKDASPAAAGGGATGDAAKPSGRGRRPATRPDDLLPDLLRMVQAAPRNNKSKIAEAFVQAHAERAVTKKWVGDMLKQHADWRGTVQGYSLKPAALHLVDPLAGAAAAAAALGAAPTLAAAAAAAPAAAVAQPGPRPVAAAPAGDGALGRAGAAAAAEAEEAGQAPQDAGGAAAAEPTPAGIKPAAPGIARFFKKGAAAAATPAVPSALRPNAPPSDLKAPGRLVTTTAAGAAAEAATLAVPECVSGTADPFWRCLLQHIEGADGAPGQQPQFLAAFQPAVLARLAAGMPAGVIAALVAGVAAAATPAATRAAYLRCLEAAVQALAAMEAEAAGDNLSASQQVWQPRGAPVAASLAELCREPQLLSGLQACLEAATAAGSGGGTDAPSSSGSGAAAVADAAQAAAALAAALLASEAARAALATADPAAAAGGGGGPQEQLAALVAAARELAA